MRIGVAGIAGRMGRLVAEEILASGASLSGGIILPAETAPAGARIFPHIDALARASDVVVDFTHPSTVSLHATALAEAGTAWVLGTTGLSAASEALVQAASARIGVVQAANFSPGVTLLLALAEKLAAVLPPETYDAEILEMHHRQKIDAPSGTALALGQAVAAGRGVDLASVRESGRDGQTGARATGAIGFAALRGGQIVGEHRLLFTSATEQIEITHKAFDRRVFASGAVRAARWVAGRPAGLYRMTNVLGMGAEA